MVALLHSNGQLRTERDGDTEKGCQKPAVQQKTTEVGVIISARRRPNTSNLVKIYSRACQHGWNNVLWLFHLLFFSDARVRVRSLDECRRVRYVAYRSRDTTMRIVDFTTKLSNINYFLSIAYHTTKLEVQNLVFVGQKEQAGLSHVASFKIWILYIFRMGKVRRFIFDIRLVQKEY